MITKYYSIRGAMHQVAFAIAIALVLSACESRPTGSRPAKQERLPLAEIKNTDEFRRIVSSAGDRLLLFDFYATWCLPCKELEPVLEAVAWQKKEVADVFRINYDENNDLAELIGVRGIPFVAFVKNQTLVYSLMGLRPQKAYLEAISSFNQSGGSTVMKSAKNGTALDLSRPPTTQPPE